MPPALIELQIRDDPAAWADAGFYVSDLTQPMIMIGAIKLRLLGNPEQSQTSTQESNQARGISAWTFGIGDSTPPSENNIDGIPTAWSQHGWVGKEQTTNEEDMIPDESGQHLKGHPNLVDHLDHVVMTTTDMPRSIDSLTNSGFELRRTRDVGSNQQAFFWAGETIIELVGPTKTAEGAPTPARLWGLAFTSSDLSRTWARLGDGLSEPKPAVQAGRQIATLKTKQFGISVPSVIMSRHPGS